jgi:hypothetical protein
MQQEASQAPTPFSPFLPEPAPNEPNQQAPKTRRKAGKKATKRAAKAVGQHDPEPAPAKRARKTRKPRAARYTLAEALEITAGLTPEDMTLVNQIASALGAQSKAARTRIAAALGRMFA